MQPASRALACPVVLLAGIAGELDAAPEDITAMLSAAGAWAYVDAAGEVRPSGSFTGVPPDSALTAAGLEARRQFDFRTDDPVLGCGEPGMPRALTAASPMTFQWNRDALVIRYESMDVTRTVIISDDDVPTGAVRSANGNARGHWEPDDTLVVRTTHLDGRVQDLLGTPKSEAMTLEERYVVEEVAGEARMSLDLIMTDPVYLTEPYRWHFDFVLKADWALLEYDCEERPDALAPGVVPEN